MFRLVCSVWRGWWVSSVEGGVGRVGTVGRNSYLTSPGNNPGHGGETSGPHAHLRLIIVLVPVFNHRASTHLPKSFSVDPTHSMWTFTGRRCNADTLAGSSFNWPPCTICALHDNTLCPNNSTYEGYYFCSNPTQPSEMFA